MFFSSILGISIISTKECITLKVRVEEANTLLKQYN